MAVAKQLEVTHSLSGSRGELEAVHAANKHSPEHHPSSAPIDIGVSHARQRSWPTATNSKPYSVVPGFTQHDIQHTAIGPGLTSHCQIRQPSTSLLPFTYILALRQAQPPPLELGS
jgi:hypothetical protein